MPRSQGTERASHDRAVYDKFAALLAPSTQGRTRSSSEIADGMKRIRRLILTDGIPEIVSPFKEWHADETGGSPLAPAADMEAAPPRGAPACGRLPAIRCHGSEPCD